MAWFKDAENGSSAPAVTVERIHRALSALGFAMGPMETPAKLVAKFDGYVTVLDVSNPTFLMIRAHFPEASSSRRPTSGMPRPCGARPSPSCRRTARTSCCKRRSPASSTRG